MTSTRRTTIRPLLFVALLACTAPSCGVVDSEERHPTAAFVPDCTTIVHVPVVFSNRSSNAVSYQWSFGDGRTSTESSPSVVYTRTGTFNVTLVARNSAGASDSM